MTKLLCIGECMIELAPTADGTFSMGFAGDTLNTAWYARRLAGPKVEVAYLTAVGDDEPSARLRAFVTSAGIVPDFAVRPDSSVGLYMISLKDGERSFSYWRSASAARTLADDLTELPGLRADDTVYFSGITIAILPVAGRERLLDALEKARAAGVRIAFDPNLRPRLWPDTDTMCDWIMRAATVADVALPSFEDEQTFFEDADTHATAGRYAGTGARIVVVKNGDAPVLLQTSEGNSTVGTEPATAVIDTTAAGDSFNAGFLVGLIEGLSAEDAVKQGCALARKVICARGALVEV
ncbi:MAG: sugar kinase [Pseudomonadota bacterium]